MPDNFKIKGLKKLNKELKNLPEDFRKKALNNSVLTATKVLGDEVRDIIPTKSGNAKSAVVVRKVKSPSKWEAVYKTTFKKKGIFGSTFYIKFVEEGTVRQPPQPFVRVAFQRKSREAVIVFGNRLKQRIDFFNRKIQRLNK